MGKSVSDYMKIAWNVFGKKVVNRMVSEKAASFVGDICSKYQVEVKYKEDLMFRIRNIVAYLEEVRTARAKAKLGWAAMEAINQRAIELQSVMKRLGERINERLLYLEPLVYDFSIDDEYYLNTFRETSLLVKALSEVAQVPLIDKNGMLSNESSVTLTNTQKILNKNL